MFKVIARICKFCFIEGFFSPHKTLICCQASLVAQIVKNPPTMQKTWVRSLGWEDPLEQGMATHSSGEFHGQRSLAGFSPWGCKELDITE